MNAIHRRAAERRLQQPEQSPDGHMRDELEAAHASNDKSYARYRGKAQDPDGTQQVTGPSSDLAGPDQVRFWFPLHPPKPMTLEAQRLFTKLEAKGKQRGEQ